MKKLKLLLIALFMIPCIVKADMGAPEIKQYEMVVIATDGVDYYPSDDAVSPSGHLDKDEKITITYEYNNTYSFNTSDDKSGVLKDLDGVKVVNEVVDPTKEKEDSAIGKNTTSKKAIVNAEKGVDIKKGPSNAYDTVAHIKKGEKLKYDYYTDTHIYVNYNGKKGWIEILDKKVLIESNDKYIARNEVEMSCATIPKNTILKPTYETDMWSHNYLIKYEDCEELVDIFKSSDLLYIDNSKAVAKSDLDVYEYNDNGGNKITTIPSGSNFTENASYGEMGEDTSYLYVTYDGKKGWVKTNYDNYEINYNEQEDEEESEEIEEAAEEIVEEEQEETTGDKEEKIVEKKKEKKSSSTDYVLICVIAGVSIALAALVTILIINKKKKNKNIVNETTSIEKSEKVEEVLPVEQQEETTEIPTKKFCAECGSEVSGKFCPKCGTKVDE